MDSYAKFISILLCLSLVSCSGGGGGGESGTSADKGLGRRTSGTGLRVIHGSLDTPPVVVQAAGKEIQSVRFGEVVGFSKLPTGPVELVVVTQNAPDRIIKTVPVTAERDTEYTLVLSGSSESNSLAVTVLPQAVEKLPIGNGKVVGINTALHSSAKFVVGDKDLGEISTGGIGQYQQLGSGAQSYRITDKNGSTLGGGTLDVPDTGEVALVLSGDSSLGYVVTAIYPDLD